MEISMSYDRFFGFNTTQKQTLQRLFDELSAAIGGDTAALETSVDNLNAWGTALATKLNADAGVTDTNYDTNPQA